MKLYAVLDVKAQLPVVVFQSNTDVEAERRFLSLLTTVENSVFTSNPGDFALECFGDFEYDSNCLHLGIEFARSKTIKSGNDYSKSYLDDTRICKLKFDEAVQTHIEDEVELRVIERLKSSGLLIADVKEVTTHE